MFRARIKRVHFVGIGGSGMSGIAEILAADAFSVSGSDLASNETTRRLQERGVRVFAGHAAANVEGADVVVYSSAIRADNPELEAARHAGIPVIPRAEMLAQLMRLKDGLAIAGAHGKTTTTSLVATILRDAGLDPTVVIGGRLNALGTGATRGAGDWLVAEADESDGSFLRLSPTLAVITNLDHEHLDHYGSFEAVKDAFVTFANRVPFFGSVVLCLDDPHTRELLSRLQCRTLTYGFSPQADLHILEALPEGLAMRFRLRYGGETYAGAVNLPGPHQVLNAAAALGVALELELDMAAALRALAGFSGVARRFSQLSAPDAAVTVIDDYGHHPTEVEKTLRAARAAFPARRIFAIFQPHRYSRTAACLEDFAVAFDAADQVWVTEVYAAGEAPIEGVDAAAVARVVAQSGHRASEPVGTLADVALRVAEEVRPGDVLLFLGAGDISRAAHGVAATLAAAAA